MSFSKIVFIFIALSLFPFTRLPAQGGISDNTHPRAECPDLDLYYRWQENETREGAYRRAYEAWSADIDKSAPDATEAGCSPCELESLSRAFSEAFWQEKDYDRAFYIALQLEELLPQVSESDYCIFR